MAVVPDSEVVFHLDDPEPARQALSEAMETVGAWVNVLPLLDPGEEPPPRNLFVAIFSSRGPELPLITISRAGNDAGTVSLGLQHPGGQKALDRLAADGLALPPGWLKIADHPRRGLVVNAPLAAAVDGLDWLIEAALRLTERSLPTRWAARTYRP